MDTNISIKVRIEDWRTIVIYLTLYLFIEFKFSMHSHNISDNRDTYVSFVFVLIYLSEMTDKVSIFFLPFHLAPKM